MLKKSLTVIAFAAVLATPAFAQNSPAQGKQMTKTEKTDTAAPSSLSDRSKSDRVNFIRQQTANDWRGSDLIGSSIYGPDNKSIGDVNDVLIAGGGEVKAVVVGVGGFLGVGEKNVALPFDALNITRKANLSAIDKITVSYTKDELKNAPKFAYFEASKSETTGSNVKSMAPIGKTDAMNTDETTKK
jgi:hypothetical protein